MPDCPPGRLYVGDQISDVVSVMLKEMARRGVQVTGTADGGTFHIAVPALGVIRGNFQISGKSLTIEILSRPVLVGCGMIESKIQDFILDAKAIIRNSRKGTP